MLLKLKIKSLLARLAPNTTEKILSSWRSYYARRFDQKQGLSVLSQKFIDSHGLQVMSGPFVGLKYVSGAVGSAFIPKLIGSYELELQPTITELLHQNIKVVVDIGCAEGFYAVGMALGLPQSRVYAFDTEPRARNLCSEMAELNGVDDRVIVQGFCSHDSLNALLSEDKALIICDCEGYEYELLQPEKIPLLQKSHVIVELHPPFDYSLEMQYQFNQRFLDKFKNTHVVNIIKADERDSRPYPALSSFSEKEKQKALSEWRSPTQIWAYLSPLSA